MRKGGAPVWPIGILFSLFLMMIVGSVFSETKIPDWIAIPILVGLAMLMQVFKHYMLFVAQRKSPEGKQALLRENVKRAINSGK